MLKLVKGTIIQPSRKVLKGYLDKGYKFYREGSEQIKVLKDTSYSYPYRYSSRLSNSELQGMWTGGIWIVETTPTNTVSFKRIYCGY